MCDLDERDAQDNGQAKHPVVRDKGKKPIVLDDADIPTNDELFSNSSPNLSPAKSNKDRSRQRHSHCSVFSKSNSDTFRRETSQGQNQSNKELGNAFTLPTGAMPLMQSSYPAFRTGPVLHIPLATVIRSPNDILSSPLGQHVLN